MTPLEQVDIEGTGIGLDRIEWKGRSLAIAGLSERYAFGTPADFSGQWERFLLRLDSISGRNGAVAYGVCYDLDSGDGFGYLCGIESTLSEDIPEDFSHRRLAPHPYAVFVHRGPVSELQETIDAIWFDWLPTSGYRMAAGADYFFERYGREFDFLTGMGDIEIWVPIELHQGGT